jgi:hypothetical protein
VVFTILFSAALAYVSKFANRLSHNRDKKLKIIYAIIIGILANYFQWSAFLMFIKFGGFPEFAHYFESIFWIFRPGTRLPIIVDLYDHGSWSFFGIYFNGIPLVLIWLVEFLIIVSGPFMAAIKPYEYPYSEKCSKWFNKYVLDKDFEIFPVAGTLAERLKLQPVQTIDSFEVGKAERHSKVFVFYIEDEDDAYVSVEKVIIATRSNGKVTREIVVDKVRIDCFAAKTILNNYKYKKEFLVMF